MIGGEQPGAGRAEALDRTRRRRRPSRRLDGGAPARASPAGLARRPSGAAGRGRTRAGARPVTPSRPVAVGLLERQAQRLHLGHEAVDVAAEAAEVADVAGAAPTARRPGRRPRRGGRRAGAAGRGPRRSSSSIRSADASCASQRLDGALRAALPGRRRPARPASSELGRSAVVGVDAGGGRRRGVWPCLATCQHSSTPVSIRSPISSSRSRSGPGGCRCTASSKRLRACMGVAARTAATARPARTGRCVGPARSRGTATRHPRRPRPAAPRPTAPAIPSAGDDADGGTARRRAGCRAATSSPGPPAA